jgi:acyl-[acyl-carrier-protein]-phospholipid O-acyltransferase/long-chain-fatty-acid--[acyl-carrier-protein] ligase
MLRILSALIARLLYRFHVFGRERIPAAGGVLVVCNRVSSLDRLVLRAACPRALVIAPDRGVDVDAIAAALQRGEAVLMFPEGMLTRSGHILAFGPEVDVVLAKVDVPVIPAATHGLWGSVLSWRDGKLGWKRPRGLRRRVNVMFGKAILTSPRRGEGGGASPPGEGLGTANPSPPTPLPSGERGARGAELRLAVESVSADLAIRMSVFTPLVHRAFISNAVSLRNLFRPCIVDNAAGEKILTWGKMFVAVMCVTRFLRAKLGPEQNVGVWLPTSLGGALANLAIALLRKTSVNLNYTAGPEAVASAAKQSGLRAVVTSKRFLLRASLELPADIERIYLEDVLATVTKSRQIRTFLLALFAPAWFIDRVLLGLHRHSVDDVLTIVFSSGSTGEPKGIVLTHRNVGSNVAAAIDTIQIDTKDKLLGVLPFFHSFGYTVALWAPLVAGAVAVYYPDPRAAKEVGNLVRKHAITLMLSTATFMRFYIRRCEADDFKSLRIIICGAEKFPVKLQDEFHTKFGVLPLEGYGCTELSPVVSTNLPDLTLGGETQVCNTRGTVGRCIVGVAMQAFTQEGRKPLPTGVEGVLCCKGPNVMREYLHQPEKTAEAIQDGWYWTGDVGLVQADGFTRITGRVSRFAKIAGEMVPLEKLEEELHDILGGGDRLLVVSAVPDEKRGERLVVLYLPELKMDLTELFETLASRGLPNLWIPDVRDCHRVDALPALGSGKLDLKRVGELAREKAGA